MSGDRCDGVCLCVYVFVFFFLSLSLVHGITHDINLSNILNSLNKLQQDLMGRIL